MDITVHRSRFIEWSPTAITCIAFPPPPLPSTSTQQDVPLPIPPRWFGTLAVGRANGNIELREWAGTSTDDCAPQAWVWRKTLPAPMKSKVENLAFSMRNPKRHSVYHPPSLADLRLFSSGGGTDVVEWDVPSGTILRTYPVHGGSIWSLAVNPTSTTLACGCDDGTIRLLNIADGALEHLKIMGPSRGKVLSISWGPPVKRAPPKLVSKPIHDNSDSDTDSESTDDDEGEEMWVDEWLASGGSDASVKRWRISTGSVIATMRTDQVRSARTLVWAVGVLPDGTIVSGDSMGLVKFWDFRTSTQLKSVQAHEADVLCLAISPDGKSLFTSGVDQCITECILTTLDPQYPLLSEWTMTRSKRVHSHDVRGLAVWPPLSLFPASETIRINPGLAPLLISGGQDMLLTIAPCAPPSLSNKVKNPLAEKNKSVTPGGVTLADGFSQKAPYPTNGLICVAREARLIVCRKAAGIMAWRLQDGGFQHVLDMDLNVATSLVSLAVSPDGRWIACSDAVEVKLFRIDTKGDGSRLQPVRIKSISATLLKQLELSSESPGAPSGSASQLLFTPDSTRMVVVCSPSSDIVVVDLSMEKEPSAVRTFPYARQAASERVVKKLPGSVDGVRDGNRPPPMVTALALSGDGQWLAAADEGGRVNVFNMDALQHHCTLPSFSLPIVSMVFSPASPQTLVLAQCNNRISVFDVEQRTFPAWAKNVCDHLPVKFTSLRPGIEGLLFVYDKANEKPELLAWGMNWISKIQLDGPRTKGSFRHQKRRRQRPGADNDEDGKEDTNFNRTMEYRSMIAVAPIGDFEASEIVVLERPVFDLLTADGQPPPFHKHHFGT